MQTLVRRRDAQIDEGKKLVFWVYRGKRPALSLQLPPSNKDQKRFYKCDSCAGRGVHTGAIGNQTASDDMPFASRILVTQVATLDMMFTELARRAALNLGEYLTLPSDLPAWR